MPPSPLAAFAAGEARASGGGCLGGALDGLTFFGGSQGGSAHLVIGLCRVGGGGLCRALRSGSGLLRLHGHAVGLIGEVCRGLSGLAGGLRRTQCAIGAGDRGVRYRTGVGGGGLRSSHGIDRRAAA